MDKEKNNLVLILLFRILSTTMTHERIHRMEQNFLCYLILYVVSKIYIVCEINGLRIEYRRNHTTYNFIPQSGAMELRVHEQKNYASAFHSCQLHDVIATSRHILSRRHKFKQKSKTNPSMDFSHNFVRSPVFSGNS